MTELTLLRDLQELLRRVSSRRFELLGVTTGGESCTVLLVNGHARSTLLCLFLIWFERRPRGFAVLLTSLHMVAGVFMFRALLRARAAHPAAPIMEASLAHAVAPSTNLQGSRWLAGRLLGNVQ